MTAQMYLDRLAALERSDEDKARQKASIAFGKHTQSSVVSCNVSFRREIDAETLVGILAGRIPIGEWKPHLQVFFNELWHETIMGVMKENRLTFEQLKKIFSLLLFQGENFTMLLKYGKPVLYPVTRERFVKQFSLHITRDEALADLDRFLSHLMADATQDVYEHLCEYLDFCREDFVRALKRVQPGMFYTEKKWYFWNDLLDVKPRLPYPGS